MTSQPFQTPLLSPDLRDLGIPEPWSFGLSDRVRFGELDILAHVNNTAYLRWFENFRITYFQTYGIADYKGGEVPRIVLRQIGVDFLAEMTLGEGYIVTGRTASMRNTSFRMEYAVWADGGIRATGWAILVLLNQQGEKIPLSNEIRETLKARDGADEV
ncbi:MAG: thioesterase family protein [Pseudomonadota bacterium]